MKHSIIGICVAIAAISFAVLPANAEESAAKSQLAGAWLLKSFKATTGDQVNYPLGEHPGGYVGFSPTRFWVMLVDTTRKAPASASMTDAEAASFMKSSAAYTGKFTCRSDPDARRRQAHDPGRRRGEPGPGRDRSRAVRTRRG